VHELVGPSHVVQIPKLCINFCAKIFNYVDYSYILVSYSEGVTPAISNRSAIIIE
jgi:hypothetical protein